MVLRGRDDSAYSALAGGIRKERGFEFANFKGS